MEEIFKDIPGYEGKYQVSNIGRVKSLSRLNSRGALMKELIMKPARHQQGYYQHMFCVNKKTKTFQAHKLMAMAFLNHKSNGHVEVVDHINGINTDNRLENLRLITQRENCYTHHKGTSKYKGVSWDKQRNRWTASIYIQGKQMRLGRYKTELEAYEVYLNKLKNETQWLKKQ